MTDTDKPKSPLSRVELGVIVTVLLAIIGGVYYIGQFEARLTSIEDDRDKIQTDISAAQQLVADTEKNAQALANQNAVPVGTIVASYLSPDPFTAKSGSQWVPADGARCPADCKYYTDNGNPERLPDLRGQFIRGLNRFTDETGDRSDGKEDPEGKERKPGHYQPSAVGPHEHKLPTLLTIAGTGKGESSDHRFGSPNGGLKSTEMVPPSVETRAANTAVYYYIKIN